MQKAAQQKVINYRKPSVGRTLVQNRTLIFMCLPAILFFFIFSYLPMPGAYIAFTQYKYGNGFWGIFTSPFVGLKNFQFLFISGQLGLLLRNTVLYNLAFIILGNVLQLAFAIMLNELACKGYKKLAQSIMFLPYFISDVLVSLLVYNLINYDYGFISTWCAALAWRCLSFTRTRQPGLISSCWFTCGSPPDMAPWFISRPSPVWIPP